MIFSQITIEQTKRIKKPNGAEKTEVTLIPLPAKKEKIVQNRLDEFQMQGLKSVVRYSLNNIGEFEDEIFEFFLDENGKKYKRTVWERDPKSNKIILEGVKADGI